MDLINRFLSRMQVEPVQRSSVHRRDFSSPLKDEMVIDSSLSPVNSRLSVKPVELKDARIGMKTRSYYRDVISQYGSNVLALEIDQIDLREAQKLESLMLLRIAMFRDYFRLPKLEESFEMIQAGRTQSQFFAGNCMKEFNNLPFHAISVSIGREKGRKMKSYADAAMDFFGKNALAMDMMSRHSLKCIGVGVWGTSWQIVVTLVM